MSEPEKYTLPRVLEIVRGHAVVIGQAGEALEATEGKDAEVLAILGERSLKASKELWDIEGGSPVGLDEDAQAPWSLLSNDNGALWALPVLVLAVEAATTNPQGALPPEPDGALPAGLRFTWCHYEAKQIAKDLMAWTKAHKGGKTSPTPGGEQEEKASASPHTPRSSRGG